MPTYVGAGLTLRRETLADERAPGQRAAALCRRAWPRTIPGSTCRSRSSTAPPTPSCRRQSTPIPMSRLLPERQPDRALARHRPHAAPRRSRSRPSPRSTAPPTAPDCAERPIAILTRSDTGRGEHMNLPFDGAISRYFRKEAPERGPQGHREGRQGRHPVARHTPIDEEMKARRLRREDGRAADRTGPPAGRSARYRQAPCRGVRRARCGRQGRHHQARCART